MSTTVQSAFKTPEDRVKDVLQHAANQHNDVDHITLAVSGGTDSIVAADVMARYGPQYGLEPDSVTHIQTGIGTPQTTLTARLIAKKHGLEFIEQGYRNPQDSIAARILENGWPGAYGGSPWGGGHGLEWANRKDKPMNAVYVGIDGQQIWVSGVRALESSNRQGNVPDTGVERDKPRRVWVSPIVGWSSREKLAYLKEHKLPVSEAYEIVGYSAECMACAYDETGLLTRMYLLCPELEWCVCTLAVWVYQRVARGDVDLAPKRLCWGWEPQDNVATDDPGQQTLGGVSQAMVGCDEDSCSTRDAAEWVDEVPSEQFIRYADVQTWWEDDIDTVVMDYLERCP